MIEIHHLLHGENVVTDTLTLADDGTIDYSGLRPQMMWLRQYLAVTEDGRPVTSEDGEEWLNALPRSPRA